MGLLRQPHSSRGRTELAPGYCSTRQRKSDSQDERLVSGTRFTMTTDDPIKKPLPDMGLLELQWHLQRIVAMLGATYWKEDFYTCDNTDKNTDVVSTADQVRTWLESLQPDKYSEP